MEDETAQRTVAFLERAEGLKDTLRSGFTATGRSEDTASHTWRLCLWLVLFGDQVDGLDQTRALRMAVIHDLGEVISGDIPAIHQVGDKSAEERADFVALLGDVDAADDLLSLWDEYEAGETLEARIVKGLDKLETILQHSQGDNPSDFDYAFNLDYGVGRTDKHSLLRQLRQI
ncbi:MAG: HD domain-containing protein, partial [Pseudomonadota bacterium]